MLREKRRHANSKPNRKLDRKSSRGMIYENEELRLRTININAEVERGQSDIKKLRRENDHLRREIWSLRDEYDRLDKLLRANPQQGVDIGERPAHVDRTIVYEDEEGEEEEDDDEDDDDDDEEEEPICEHCQQYEESCECTLPDKINAATAASFRPRPPPRDRSNFDDLSVVSEETTHSTDTVLTDPDTQRLSLNAPPLGAFEYQSNVPSLSHFENLCYERIGPNLSASGELVYDAGHGSGSGGGGGSGGTAANSDGAASPAQSPSVAVPTAFQDETAAGGGAGCGPPDICMYTAGMPLRVRPRSGQPNGSAGRFPTGGNLDDLLHDLDNLSVDHSLALGGEKRRKQRSEMNLILSHDGAISSISSTPVTPAAIPISVDTPSPQQPLPAAPPPPIGWKPELPPKPDKPPKPKFPWIGRSGPTVQPAATGKPPTHAQSAQQIRRKSITAQADAGSGSQAPKAPATATISKRRFSLRRASDAIAAAGAAAKPPVVPPTTSSAGGAGAVGSSAERGSTTHGSVSSSSPESSTSISLRSQRPQPRRISTGSHDNATGSIPWCACWGNGCI